MIRSPFIFIIISILSVFMLLSCSIEQSPREITAKEVYPVIQDSREDSGESASGEITQSLDESMIPKINIPGGYKCFDIKTENLDLDRADEQILLCQNSDTGKAELWIVDYDGIKDTYFISYKYSLGVSEFRRFQVITEDLIGDHIPEILCFGTNPDGTQTLDVFRKSNHPTGIGLYYGAIFSEGIQGTIEIVRKERNSSYNEGISNGKSFSIETYTQDRSSEDYNDLIRSSYFFRYQTNSYVLVDSEKISGDRVDEEQLRLLYTKGVDEYKSFIDGPWFKTDTQSRTPSPTLVLFDKDMRRVTYYSEGTQEVLIWTTSSKPLYNKLVVYGVNELIPDLMSRVLTVSVIDINTIYIYGLEPWRGSYSRFSDDLQEELLEEDVSGYSPPELSGVYTSQEGASLFFSKNRYSLTRDGKDEKGGYAFYLKGNPIIAFKAISERGILLDERVYKYDFFEETKENKIIRTLVLFPGKMSVRGFVPTIDSYIQYQQIETIEPEEL